MINVYRVNEYDWVAAESLSAAAAFYVEHTGEEIDHDDAYELDATDMNRIKLSAEEGVYGLNAGVYTFQAALDSALAIGWETPFLFASTEQ
jgi:hypothetical protein